MAYGSHVLNDVEAISSAAVEGPGLPLDEAQGGVSVKLPERQLESLGEQGLVRDTSIARVGLDVVEALKVVRMNLQREESDTRPTDEVAVLVVDNGLDCGGVDDSESLVVG